MDPLAVLFTVGAGKHLLAQAVEIFENPGNFRFGEITVGPILFRLPVRRSGR